MSVHITEYNVVHNTAQNSSDNLPVLIIFPLTLQTIITTTATSKYRRTHACSLGSCSIRKHTGRSWSRQSLVYMDTVHRRPRTPGPEYRWHGTGTAHIEGSRSSQRYTCNHKLICSFLFIFYLNNNDYKLANSKLKKFDLIYILKIELLEKN